MPDRAGAALALVLVALFPARAQDESDEEPAPAEELLARAERSYSKGRYDEAVRTYRRLAREHPDTDAGRIGEQRSQSSGFLGATLVVDHGPSANRVDVVLMGEGYQLEEQKGFDALAEDVPRLFDHQKTFREYLRYLNFWRANLVSADNGVDGFGREYDTALNGETIGTIAGHVAVDRGAVRAMLELMPAHDNLAVVFVRNGTLGTGGGGIATIGGSNARTTVHEFGHAFAGLGDEYATTTHQRGGVGVAINVAATDDPKLVPWAHWIEYGYPGVGVYEGASGQVRGAWKPTSGGCVMESGEFFCAPCQEALVLAIHDLVDPIDGCEPPAVPRDHSASYTIADELELELRVLQPATHELLVQWWVLPERGSPPDPRATQERYANRQSGRSARGPLANIGAEPMRTTRPDRDGVHRLHLKRSELEPGRYRVVARVKDDALPRGEKHPWVIRDPYGLLESERAWWVEVPLE